MGDERSGGGFEARYHQILDSAPDAMLVVAPDERLVFVNMQTERMFGYTRAELIGQRLDLLIPERFRGAHRSHIQRFMTAPTVRPMGSGLSLFGRRRDGTEIPIEVSLSPFSGPDGVMISAALRDITERKRIESSARLFADRLEGAIESIQDGIAMFDADGRLLLCNQVYRGLLGAWVQGELPGRSYEELFASGLGGAAPALCVRSYATHDVRTADERSFRIANRPTLEGGIVQTIWDLTDDVRREEELRRARAAAEAGSAAKSEFLSSMSHELRTPLNAILGFAQLLCRSKKEPLSERQRAQVDQILKGGEHLLRLIDDILDLSRIESGGVSISTEPVDLLEVLEEVCTTLQPMAAPDQIRIEIDPVPEELPMIAADRMRFVQILMNYGSNAIKYNRRGGRVGFTVLARGHDRVRVTVADAGIGIPVDKQSKLFQPFQRAGQETGPIQGTGIGLVITRRLAEIMGGSVGFRSEPGVGSEFWVEMPVHPSGARSQPPPALKKASLPPLLSQERPIVLYVEDNPANVLFMRDLLSTFDMADMITAPTAEMGIELAREQRPAVIIMDINLPGIDGLEALGLLRELPETRRIPVIALTAAASSRDKQRGEEAGFFRYLTKPVQVDELETALGLLLGRAEA